MQICKYLQKKTTVQTLLISMSVWTKPFWHPRNTGRALVYVSVSKLIRWNLSSAVSSSHLDGNPATSTSWSNVCETSSQSADAFPCPSSRTRRCVDARTRARDAEPSRRRSVYQSTSYLSAGVARCGWIQRWSSELDALWRSPAECSLRFSTFPSSILHIHRNCIDADCLNILFATKNNLKDFTSVLWRCWLGNMASAGPVNLTGALHVFWLQLSPPFTSSLAPIKSRKEIFGSVVKVVLWSRGLTWRSQVGANPIPIPTPLIWRYLGIK